MDLLEQAIHGDITQKHTIRKIGGSIFFGLSRDCSNDYSRYNSDKHTGYKRKLTNQRLKNLMPKTMH